MEGYDFLFNFDRKYVSIYTTPLTKYSELFVESLLRVPGLLYGTDSAILCANLTTDVWPFW